MEKGINVFSGCDGIGCLRQVLKQMGIVVNKYYASEIQPGAIKVAMKNHPDIIQMGDILRWREWNIDWASINLLTFGFPCQSFSMTGKKKGFKDPMTKKIFIACIEIYYRVKDLNPNVQVIFENVVMKEEPRKIITDYIGIEPIMLDSSLVSAQRRKRLYWTNIPGVIPPTDRGLKLTDIVPGAVAFGSHGRNTGLKKPNGKVKWVLTKTYNKKNKSYCMTRNNGYSQYEKDGVELKYTAAECEQLQTLPVDYTKADGISERERIEMVGNAWTIDMIEYIISRSPKYKLWTTHDIPDIFKFVHKLTSHEKKRLKENHNRASELLKTPD